MTCKQTTKVNPEREHERFTLDFNPRGDCAVGQTVYASVAFWNARVQDLCSTKGI